MITVIFEDQGQGFLEWDIESGIVTGCRPVQDYVWVGTRVHNDDIQPGVLLEITLANGERTQVGYPVVKVTDPPKSKTLYCVGCGQRVAEATPGKMLAIACACGAMAPILRTEDGTWYPPASLVRATGAFLPHLEYYLGFSEYESPAKEEARRMLRAMGSTSYAECPDTDCRIAFEEERKRYERLQEIKEKRDNQAN